VGLNENCCIPKNQLFIKECLFSGSHFRRETANENNYLKETKRF